MNFLELRTQVLSWLDDVNAGYFTSSQVNRWLNNAQYETQKQLLQAGENYYLECVQTTLVVNQQDYVLPDDFMKLHRLELILSGSPPNQDVTPLAPITLNQQDLVAANTGQPQYYVIKRNRLMLFPTPDTAASIKLFYSPRVAELSADTDVPDVPQHYHEYIAVLATIDGLLKDGRPMEAMMVKKNDYLSMLKADSEERNQDAPRSIVMTGSDDMYGGWGF